MIFQLDLPPSTNRLWRRSGTIIHKSAEYRDWLTKAGWQLAEQVKGCATLKGPVAVEVFAGKMHASRDLDSIIKPIGDFLQQAQIVSDDNQVRDWRVAADCDSVARNTVLVAVRPIGAALHDRRDAA